MTPGPRDLARLVLSDRARDVAEDAIRLVPTLDDPTWRPGEHLDRVVQLRARVDELVEAAVLHAREQGIVWSEVARTLRMRERSVVERWSPVEQQWRDGLVEPVREQPGSDLPVMAVPAAAAAPAAYAADLDEWSAHHNDPVERERWRDRGQDPARPVSGGLAE